MADSNLPVDLKSTASDLAQRIADNIDKAIHNPDDFTARQQLQDEVQIFREKNKPSDLMEKVNGDLQQIEYRTFKETGKDAPSIKVSVGWGSFPSTISAEFPLEGTHRDYPHNELEAQRYGDGIMNKPNSGSITVTADGKAERVDITRDQLDRTPATVVTNKGGWDYKIY